MSDLAIRRSRRALDGLLLLDKPTGITSNAALQRVKWLFQARKAGHTGSLDPLATGMLPICFGEATKFSGYLLDADKIYRVQARFGARTDTGDADGTIVETHNRSPVLPAELEDALAGLRGPIRQIPPMYSALKQEGQRLYALARAGRVVPRESRPVAIHEFSVDTYDPLTPVFLVRCSKGTYVRTLIEDLASGLGTLAHVIALRRLAVLPFDGRTMLSLDQIEAAAGTSLDPDLAALDALLHPLEAVLPHWPAVELDAPAAFRVSRGGLAEVPHGHVPGMVRLYTPGRQFLGVGEIQPDGLVAPRRLLASESRSFHPASITGL